MNRRQRATRVVERGRLGPASVPAAFFAANALSYLLVLAAAHRMTPAQYGEVSSLLGLLAISTIPMLALQTVAARRSAVDAERDGAVDAERSGADSGLAGLVHDTALVAGGVTVLLLAASPALAAFLHLRGVLGVVAVAATVPATAALGTATGVAQGRRRFYRLAALILLATGARAVGGLVGLVLDPTPLSTLLGILVATTAAAAIVVRPHLATFTSARHQHAATLREILHAGHTHGTFLLLSSLDVLLARHVLSRHDAGVYAVGAVVSRAALWLPQSVVLLVFASLAQAHRHDVTVRRAGGAVLALDAVSTAVAAAAGPLLVTFVGGARYHGLDHTIWLYAALGGLLAVLQFSAVAGLARRDARRSALLWAAVVADVALALTTSTAHTPTGLVSLLVVVAAVAATAGAVVALRRPDGPAEVAGQEAAAAGQAPGV